MKKPSGRITSSQVVMSGPGTYYGFLAKLGTGEGQVILYDNPTTAAGVVVDELLMDGTEQKTGSRDHSIGIPCVSGLYCVVSGVVSVNIYSSENPLQG